MLLFFICQNDYLFQMKPPVCALLLAIGLLFSACGNNPGASEGELLSLPSDADEPNIDTVEVFTETIISGLDVPWEIAWGPDDWIWYTEQDGRISKLNPETGETKVLVEIPDVYRIRLGLLSMAIHPDIDNFPYVFFNYTFLKGEEIRSKLVRYTYVGEVLEQPRVLLEWPGLSGHNGSRIAISPDGKVMVATGDAFIPRGNQDANLLNGSQKTNSLNGKVLRLNIDGSIPEDNPISGSPVWARGFRVPQGMAYSAKGNLYTAEHGHSNDDEVNLIHKAGNYGFPNVEGFCDMPEEMDFCSTHNVVEPLRSWTPTIAPAGLDFYNTGSISAWNNAVLLVTLKTQSLRVLKMNPAGDEVLSEHVYFEEEFGRLRDLCVSPDGEVYMSTSNRDWNPVEGFPVESDDRIIRISASRGEVAYKGRRIDGRQATLEAIESDKHALKAAGATVYKDYCASCHKNDGKGLPGLSPSLSGSSRITGEKEDLIHTILTGNTGSTTAEKTEYEQTMPGFSFLDDREIAAVLSFIRSEFGGDSPAISSGEVAKVREKGSSAAQSP